MIISEVLTVKKDKPVDYEKAMRDFEKSQKGPVMRKEKPFKSTILPDGGVDYLAVSRAYEKAMIEDQSEVVRNEKD